jgi:superfamily II DNA or RNA helicase
MSELPPELPGLQRPKLQPLPMIPTIPRSSLIPRPHIPPVTPRKAGQPMPPIINPPQNIIRPSIQIPTLSQPVQLPTLSQPSILSQPSVQLGEPSAKARPVLPPRSGPSVSMIVPAKIVARPAVRPAPVVQPPKGPSVKNRSVVKLPSPVGQTGQIGQSNIKPPLIKIPLVRDEIEEDENELQQEIVEELGPVELVLRPWQVDWANKAHGILMGNYGYIDTSKMGRGKTTIALWLAKQFGFSLLVICPVGVIDTWQSEARKYEVHLIDAISYQSLRSTEGHQPNHPYLIRYDEYSVSGRHSLEFDVTKEYSDLLNTGILVIFDEFQNIKNTTAQFKAAKTMIRAIITGGGKSRYGLLSGTPLEKEEQATNLVKILGYHYNNKTGLNEFIYACNFIDQVATQEVLSRVPRGNKAGLVYELYRVILKPRLSGGIAPPQNITGEFDAKNGFYNIIPENQIALQQTFKRIREETGLINENEEEPVRMNLSTIQRLVKALVPIEQAKLYDMARVGRDILNSDDHNKVIISVNYTKKSIPYLLELLQDFNPLTLTGQTKPKDRKPIQDLFNNDPDYRLLLMNTKVGGVGINLHDTTGLYPRFMLISPSYNLSDIAQAATRIYRDGLQSKATIRIFYGKVTGPLEVRMRESLATKTGTLGGIIEYDPTILLPGDYESEFEPDQID